MSAPGGTTGESPRGADEGSSMNVVHLGDVAAQPWRNGGGVTHELLAWPLNAPLNAPWCCRVSVADITRDGDFSAFPGVDRWFAVIEGGGVDLTFGSDVVALTSTSAPCRFDGEAAPGCRLPAGPTRDLNLMAQRANAQGRGHGHGQMQRVLSNAAWQSGADWRGVYTATALSLQMGKRPAMALPAGTLAWSDSDANTPWRATLPTGSTQAWWLGFHRPGA